MIGIDRIILNKLKINNFDTLDKKNLFTKEKNSEYLEFKNDFCELKFSYHLPRHGEDYLMSSLDFNPNVILRGDNIKNATIEEVEEALEIVVSSIKREGIGIDLSEAAVKYVEINKNLPIDYEALEEVFLAIGRANFKKAFGHHNFLEEDSTREIKKEKSLYINLKQEMYNPERYEDSAVILAYDKSQEVFNKKKKFIDPQTRIELKCGRDFYRNELKKMGLGNDLETLFKNPEVIQKIFKEKVDKVYFRNTEKYIQNTLKKNLKADFIAFKRTEKSKRKIRRELTLKKKEIPEIYRENRGVFEHLKNNSWIFDSSFLIEVVKKNVASKNIKSSLVQIEKKYSSIQNYKLLKELKERLEIG